MDCPGADTLCAMVAGRLSATERAGIANHAAGCETCHALISGLLETAEAVSPGVGETLAKGLPPGRPAADAPRTLAAGARIDRYVIESWLGSGGMGVVYAARDPELGRRVALKLLRPGAPDERLRREARSLARLSHPNVVAVHDVGEHEGQTFVAMALIDGVNLREWLQQPRSTADIVQQLLAAARGLAAAHRGGLIHRDLKPDNIFVPDGGHALVGDFGLARQLASGDGEPAGAAPGTPAGDISVLTETGAMLGTPAYMAPEQATGEATAASDQFSFCVTAWEALHGARPFAGRKLEEILAAARDGRIEEPATDRDVPAPLQHALRRGLAADAAQRFPSMDALLVALSPRARRWPRLLAGAAAIALAGAAVTMLAIGTGARADPGARCAGTEALLADVWSPARRDELEQLLVARGAEQAADTPRVLASVDRYAEAWISTRHDACLAAHVRHELRPEALEARVSCLDDRAVALRSGLAVIAADGGPGATASWRLIEQLRAVDRCTRARASEPGAAPRSPEVLALRDRLAGIEALVGLGRPLGGEQAEELRRLRAEAERLGDGPLLLQALLHESRLALDGAYPEQAELAARRALALAETEEDDLGKAHAGALLVEALVRLLRLPEAEGQLAQAAAALERGGGDWEVGIAIAHARAVAANAAGDAAGQIAALREILDTQRSHRGEESLAVVNAAIDLSGAYLIDHQPDQARALVDLIQRAGGPELSPVEATAVRAYTATMDAYSIGDFPRAIEQGSLLVAILREDDDPDDGGVVNTLALILETSGDWIAARDTYREAARLFRLVTPGHTADLVAALTSQGKVELELGDPAAALAPLREALALSSTGDATLADGLERSRGELGRALLDSGKPAEAIEYLEPALRTIEADPESKGLRRAMVAFTLAQCLWATGGPRQRDRARSLAADAARDYAAQVDELALNPVFATLHRVTQQRLATLAEWQRRHP